MENAKHKAEPLALPAAAVGAGGLLVAAEYDRAKKRQRRVSKGDLGEMREWLPKIYSHGKTIRRVDAAMDTSRGAEKFMDAKKQPTLRRKAKTHAANAAYRLGYREPEVKIGAAATASGGAMVGGLTAVNHVWPKDAHKESLVGKAWNQTDYGMPPSAHPIGDRITPSNAVLGGAAGAAAVSARSFSNARNMDNTLMDRHELNQRGLDSAKLKRQAAQKDVDYVHRGRSVTKPLKPTKYRTLRADQGMSRAMIDEGRAAGRVRQSYTALGRADKLASHARGAGALGAVGAVGLGYLGMKMKSRQNSQVQY
jgi:hypothetical protein